MRRFALEGGFLRDDTAPGLRGAWPSASRGPPAGGRGQHPASESTFRHGDWYGGPEESEAPWDGWAPTTARGRGPAGPPSWGPSCPPGAGPPCGGGRHPPGGSASPSSDSSATYQSWGQSTGGDSVHRASSGHSAHHYASAGLSPLGGVELARAPVAPGGGPGPLYDTGTSGFFLEDFSASGLDSAGQGAFLPAGTGGFIPAAPSELAPRGPSSAPAAGAAPDPSARCSRCSAPGCDAEWSRAFSIQICGPCASRERLVSRSAAKATFAVTEADLRGLGHVLRPNPHDPRWAPMQMLLVSQVEERAAAKHGSAEAAREARYEAARARLEARAKRREREEGAGAAAAERLAAIKRRLRDEDGDTGGWNGVEPDELDEELL